MRINRLGLWLQSASLLAVLAGYAVLLVLNQSLSILQRHQAHRYLVDQVMMDLRARSGDSLQLQQRLQTLNSIPGLSLTPMGPSSADSAPGDTSSAPTEISAPLLQRQQRGERTWLVSTVAVPQPNGPAFRFLLGQDVTDSVQRQGLGLALLVVAAGVVSLLTSGLLRLVLHRGLTRPLEAFSALLSGTHAPPLPGDQLPVEQQPEELRPIARAFNALQQRLAASWERQRSFVDAVAHELRTPITLVSGHAQRLLRDGQEPAFRPSLKLIQEESDRMGTLVTDLLDLARQDSGRLRLLRQPLIAEDVLLALYERMAANSSARLRLAEQDEQPLPVAAGDADRLQQCLTALVDNALRYSPAPAPVSVGASVGPAGQLVLWVRDQGPGVPVAERQRIFERFVRGSAAGTCHERGSGIGLAVVELLMQAMGGSVRVDEAPGGGAEFQLLLPPFSP